MTPLSLNRSPDPGDDLAKGQIRQVNEALILAPKAHARTTEHVVSLILRGCGLL